MAKIASFRRIRLLLYTPYGFRPHLEGTVLRFAGQAQDPVTGHYLLGNGQRSYSPWLMRFCSSDRLSPFGHGGINSYAYCAGDPVNQVDPSGHAPLRRLSGDSTVSEPSRLQHYAARVATAAGSGIGMVIALVDIASEHQNAPAGSIPPGQRLRRIAGFHALAIGAISDGYEVFLPVGDAGRVGPVDNMGLAGAGFFALDASIGVASNVYQHGWRGLAVNVRSLAYALGEVSLIGPLKDLMIYGYKRMSARSAQQNPVELMNVIRQSGSRV
ncbi:RHS repeat-associated core domain-containing protein [Pseudomonas sp. NPDC089422]|uniref:RHS repeat-associated core domain-containing protein n=1 Tax=Pseudomonas sp. NPDC089422 TaxID=3364466 RepID=UPI00381823B0